ncbi:MAG: DNA repair protein RadC [Saprospiraceae bacterium]|jgi:DNA repair protein RadC|nr:DNA repair protein RadC [Saprospiraceae bacterium]
MTNKKKQNLAITAWSEDDQPRYRLKQHGSQTLSDSELLAILMRTGTSGLSAVDLGKHILKKVNGDLNQLARLSVKQLTQINGIGEAKAICILAALELGRRRDNQGQKERITITDSRSAYRAMSHLLIDKTQEEFWLVSLSRSNQVLNRKLISIGGVAGTVVDPKILFQQALEHLASGIILYHNHPSGRLKPSRADITLTQKLKQAGDLLDIKVLDHLIITHNGYLSFADEGLMG